MKNDNGLIKQTFKQFKEQLCTEFNTTAHIPAIAKKLAVFIDDLLIDLFNKNKLATPDNFCLLALGSYGRRELQLHSDIDLLLLHSPNPSQEEIDNAQKFIQDCWDIGLEVSHQITTVAQCALLAANDLSIISTLMDMFLICGKGSLMDELIYQTQPLHMWPSHHYFFAKVEEQKKRYLKYGETAYNLEPNIKYGPGGLRDIQIILSISKRHFKAKKLADGISYGFISDKEYEELMYCQHFLWRVRFELHRIAGKAEERLSFDYQIKIAKAFGYKDKTSSLAIEQFMKEYFKVIQRTKELNEMLLQWFDETIIYHQKQKLIPLDNDFQLSNEYIEVRHPNVFKKKPHTLLTLFLWIAKYPSIQGVRASTIRLLRESLFLMNTHLFNDVAVTPIFMSILSYDPYEALQRMSRYGVLGHYLECFATVTGQMQYDLFHAYTVDQHTLFVIRNLSRFKQGEYASLFPLCAQVITTIKKQEILYLSALFHDIAKGRGGDHSELGAIEALECARRHQLTQEDTELLVWLVKNHLLMSQTAQRQDIYDPNTIKQFCLKLPHFYYIDYLYCLTVADICATNPSLWNSWKDSLLKELYHAAKAMILKEQQVLDEDLFIAQKKEEALIILASDYENEQVYALWDQFRGKYFLHESPEVIARHTKAILNCSTFPLVMIMPHHSQGAMEVFIYMPHKDERFTITTTVLSNHHVTIQEALISTCNNQFDLDTYIILDEQQQAFFDKKRLDSIQKALVTSLCARDNLPKVIKRRLSPTLAHFHVSPKITFTQEKFSAHTSLFLITSDRPGLLALISRAFLNHSIHVHGAKIVTAGERVEDTFYITNNQGERLSGDEETKLRHSLLHELSKNNS